MLERAEVKRLVKSRLLHAVFETGLVLFREKMIRLDSVECEVLLIVLVIVSLLARRDLRIRVWLEVDGMVTTSACSLEVTV